MMEVEKEHYEVWSQASLRKAIYFLGALQIALIILFASCSTYKNLDSSSAGTITQGYTYFIGVEIMM